MHGHPFLMEGCAPCHSLNFCFACFLSIQDYLPLQTDVFMTLKFCFYFLFLLCILCIQEPSFITLMCIPNTIILITEFHVKQFVKHHQSSGQVAAIFSSAIFFSFSLSLFFNLMEFRHFLRCHQTNLEDLTMNGTNVQHLTYIKDSKIGQV